MTQGPNDEKMDRSQVVVPLASARSLSTVSRYSDALGRDDFVRQVEIEKRRTDRSKLPLSLVVFRIGADATNGTPGVDRLVEAILPIKRETDVLGYLGENRVALLLTDTSPKGAEGFVASLPLRVNWLRYETAAATYPNELFENLLTGKKPKTGESPFSIHEPDQHGPVDAFLKRTLDIIGASALMLVLSPIILATAIAVKSTSVGPVIFRQTRLGRRGVPFNFYKFRSMVINSDDSAHRAYVSSLIKGDDAQVNLGDSSSPHYKIKNDPRITPVGRFIRKSSIDELPQLVNVLKGEMSLVGPRPPLPYEAEKYDSWHFRRILEVKPGITGLWQVEGRNKVPFDEMVRLDLRYARNWSLWLDIKILFKTVFAVLRMDGEG